MGEINHIVKTITVDAGMAAAAYKLLVFDYEHPEGEWRTFPLETRHRWPIRLHSLFCEMQNASYAVREGHVASICAVHPTTVSGLVSDQLMAWNDPVKFYGDLPLDYGFGILWWAGSLVNTDIIYVRASYQMRR